MEMNHIDLFNFLFDPKEQYDLSSTIPTGTKT